MNYTSIEQSKHLLELGLKAETADMYYDGHGKYPRGYAQILIFPNSFEYDLPCWSIGALIQTIDKPLQITYFRKESGNYYEVLDSELHGAREESLIDALYKYLTETIIKWSR